MSLTALQLLSVFLLIFAIIYIYAVMSFALLHDFFSRESGQFCDNLGMCFVTVLRGGLLDTLGRVRLHFLMFRHILETNE